MSKHLINDSRTVILGRGKESGSALQQLVSRSMQLKNNNSQSTAKPIAQKKDIPGYEGLYAITEDGKVYSYPKASSLMLDNSNRYMKPDINKSVRLLKIGHPPKRFTINTLLALTYGKDHKIDKIKEDNKISNVYDSVPIIKQKQDNTAFSLEIPILYYVIKKDRTNQGIKKLLTSLFIGFLSFCTLSLFTLIIIALMVKHI